MPEPISWVVLDAMGVIYEQRGVSALLAEFAGRLGVAVDPRAARKVYIEASLGRMSSADLWEALGVPGPERDAQFLAGRLLMPGIRDFLAEMVEEGIQVGCITNDVAEWSVRQRQLYGLEEGIEPWIVSGEVGVRKPSSEIYERFLAAAGCQPGDAMFIDDSIENVRSAARLGFRTLQFPGSFRAVLDLISQLHTVA